LLDRAFRVVTCPPDMVFGVEDQSCSPAALDIVLKDISGIFAVVQNPKGTP